MKSFEERYTAWLDDALDATDREEFEKELPDAAEAARERDEWGRLRGMLREAVEPARMPHGDFVNSRILAAIERESMPSRRAQRGWFPLPRLAFAGGFLLVLAAVLSVLFLSGPSVEVPAMSQVVQTQAWDTGTHAYVFDAPGRAAVLWIDNAGYIPANERL